VQLPESATVRWMQSWRHVAASLAVLVLLIAAGWRWGVPLAADATVLLMSPETEQRLGEGALAELDKQWLKPSALSAAEQQAISQRFAEALARTQDRLGPPPPYRLNFRAAHKAIGPNAFALPGGDIVLTDALVKLLADTPDALVGVLGHELGHLRHRHGLRQVVQAGIVGAAAGLLVGDFSALLAAAPAVLAESAYSRDFEREADEEARQLLRAAGISPRVMTAFYERAEKAHPGQTPIAIASHPATEERIRFFSE
jgi:predicted Zn-dependent protease